MNSLERVSLTLQHQEPDRVPVYPLICGASRRLVGVSYEAWAKDPEVTARAYLAATEEFQLDVICTLIDLSVEAADFGQKIIYPQDEAAHPDRQQYLIGSLQEYARVQPINPRKGPRMRHQIDLCHRLYKAKGKEVPLVAFVFGPLGILSMLRGQAELFMDAYDDPGIVKQAVGAITDTLIEYVDALVETGVHAIMLDTLFASQSIMSKAMWMDLEGQFVAKLANHIHSRGVMVMVHNCGHGIYFEAQIETMRPQAISFLHTPDDCATFEETQRKYGSQTTLIGHVPPTWLPSATLEEVEAECRRQMEIHKAGGGYILATGCEYPANMSFDAAQVMVRTAMQYGQY